MRQSIANCNRNMMGFQMKLSFFIVVLQLASILAQESVVGQACNKTAQCSTTCGKIIYCDNENITNAGVDCPASHPYCVTDVRADRCSNVEDPLRPECWKSHVTWNDFFCTDVGYFPDPKNCQNYYICSYDHILADIVPQRYECPPGHIFNYARNKECTRYVNPPASYCPNITCNSQEPSYAIVHPRDSSYYYFCMPHPMIPGDNYVPIMFRCDDGWTFNGRRCTFNCQREGRYSVKGSDTAYYECSYVNGRYEFTVEKCPKGFKFVQSIGFCQLQ
ncbi:uncharacterized protein LOC134836803 [Culicoides brevitarsis]|uniref:uncharacterized protein LOC134836803 n=1 Tax=Culicoides brevitarsis TaxID=469753 RepID=UPI00307B10A7